MHNTNINAQINEIFDSIQGEGPYIGYRQLFIRFCGCNLMCGYCDTDFQNGDTYSVEELVKEVKDYNLKAIHSISLTGGEPLLHYEFLNEFLPQTEGKIYLETNGVLTKALEKIIDKVDIISADIKLDSAAKIGDLFNAHDNFIGVAIKNKKEIFAKIVFDDKIEDFEINECLELGKKYRIPLILQPKMNGNEIGISKDKITEIFNSFTDSYPNTRLIGQVHKFFDIR